jgi:hypothetical protein
MIRDSITITISNTVAENALCWCDGRSSRKTREIGLAGFAEEEDSGTISRFYTGKAASLVTMVGSNS